MRQVDCGTEIVYLRIMMIIYGFAPAIIYAPLFLIYISYILLFRKTKFDINLLIYFLIAFFYILYTFSLGNSYLNNWHFTMSTQLISLVTLFLIAVSNCREHLFELTKYFLIGVGLHVALLISASMYMDPLLISRNLLYSPIVQEIVGTAAQSNYLSLVGCLILYHAAKQRKTFGTLVSLSCFTIILIAGAAMAGRAFFVNIGVFGLLIGVHYFSLKKILTLILFLGLNIFFVIFFFDYVVEPIFNKFESGFSSLRFEHWAHGLKVAPDYPFGGFEVNQAIEEIGSFHNILFDSARMGGFVSLILILILLMPSVLFLKNKILDEFDFVYAISIVCILIMMQDVVIEGLYKILLIYFMANFKLLKSSRMHVPPPKFDTFERKRLI